MAAMRNARRLWNSHPHVRSHDELTFGERAADVMRNAFGSWGFVGGFLAFMAVWMVLNSPWGPHVWDKYPWVLLNLGLSMMAGLQGALILIAAKRADRVAAEQATAHYGETRQLHDLVEQVKAVNDKQMTMLGQLETIRDQASAISAVVCQVADPLPAPPEAAAPVTARKPPPRKGSRAARG